MIKRSMKISIVAMVALLFGGAIGWSLFAVFSPIPEVESSSSVALYQVTEGEVGSALRINAVAEWKPIPIAVSQSTGVVTSLRFENGSEAVPGTVLFSVNETPVVAAQGDVPAYRDIQRGDAGGDVSQLQRFLSTVGFYSGEADGVAGYLTESAIKSWQKALGTQQTGVVRLGDVVFFPTLPARVVLNTDALKLGANLSGGENLVSVAPATPEFSVSLTLAQASALPKPATARLQSAEGEVWEGVLSDEKFDKDAQTVTYVVRREDSSPVCLEQCTEIPVLGRSTFPAEIVLVAPVSGQIVPASAIRTTVEGKTVVIDQDGAEIQIEILGSAEGMSAVSGLKTGAVIRVNPSRSDPLPSEEHSS